MKPAPNTTSNGWFHRRVGRMPVIMLLSVSFAAMALMGGTPGFSIGAESVSSPKNPILLRPLQVRHLHSVAKEAIDDLNRKSASDKLRRLQIGVARQLSPAISVNARNWQAADWKRAPDNSVGQSAQVTSSGALGIRVHLENVKLPPSGVIFIYDPALPAQAVFRLDASVLATNTDWWSPTLFSETAAIEARAATLEEAQLISFTINEISHIYRSPSPPSHLKEGSCEHDASCYPDYADAANSVALITYVQGGGTYMCTGCAVETTPGAVGDYFLTARHCIHTQGQASTLEFYWLFQTPGCNADPPLVSSVPKTTGGAELLATGVSDFSFLKLKAAPPAGARRAQWTIQPPNSSEFLACIHHPDGSYKRASFGVYLGSNPYYLAIQWASGVTEPGSSGAPLFNSDHKIVGTLTGGFDGPGSSCDNPSALDQFGRFDVTYPFIQKWIDPSGVNGGPPPLDATYYSLFYDQAAPGIPGSSGSITLATTTKGKFTGRIQMGAQVYPFLGSLNANGVGFSTIKRSKTADLTLQFSINLAEGGDDVSGLVTDGNWTALVNGNRAVYGKTNAAPQAGAYTLIIPGGQGAGPAGAGYGSAIVDKSGRIVFTGALADGTKISQSTFISRTGAWPLYIPLYKGQGSLFGWVTIAASDTGDLSGQILWFRPNPDGYTISASLAGSGYTPPPKGGSVLQGTNLVFVAAGGALSSPVQANVTIQKNGKCAVEDGKKIRLNFLSRTGALNGALIADGIKGALPLHGVVLQKQNIAAGYFGGGSLAGSILLQPISPQPDPPPPPADPPPGN